MKRAAFCIFLASVPTVAFAQPDYGLDFVNIGDPGNAPYVPTDTTWVDRPIGGVNYEYRIMRTEVTVAQWVEFANAYAPYYTGSRLHPEITGYWVAPDSLDPDVPLSFHAVPGSERYTADTSWRMAARFCNWLHNGKSSEASAFESGVYDTSTFGKDENNFYTDQSSPSPGAKYWMPSWDEWVKAAYYDPRKGGENSPGYWSFPVSSDIAPVSGLPEENGQTNAGSYFWDEQYGFLDVGSYPTVQSPWGLLDASGSLSEWTGSWASSEGNFTRKVSGSSLFDQYWIDSERIDGRGDYFPWVTGVAIRLATTVPSPGISAIGVGGLLVLGRRRSTFERNH
ncbi:MAG: SUMF1/EgtB/PvdO family nonheme iron enzyme [Phycisphaerales bacterium]|nr:SUMF1/EgtB/PvdO family nonheme iron enzyme [Phycisphaerales bacterium]